MISNPSYNKLIAQLTTDLGKKELLEQQLQDLKNKLTTAKQRSIDAQEARAIIQEVARDTEANLEMHISTIVTAAVQAVDTEWPEFVTRFETRRNQPECDLLFREHNNEYPPLEGSGGGAQNIAAFSCRIAIGSLTGVRPVYILDEPFRDVSPDRQEKVSEMLNMVCDDLGLQIIMVSHADDINIKADRTFLNEKKGQISEVKIIE